MIKDLLPWKKSKETDVPVRRREDPVAELHSRLNTLFDSFFEDFASPFPAVRSGKDLVPALEVSESDTAIEIDAELPGLDPESIDVTIDGNYLTIKGEKKEEKEEKKKNYHITERSYGSFSRTLNIPSESLDLDKVESKFKNGVLHLKLPKNAESQSKRRKIKVGS
jgi:HSP20 family protein